MGVTQQHALGRNRKFFAKTESAFGTFIKPTATDAAKMLSSKIELAIAREARMDSRQTRSILERYTGLKTVKWSCEGYVIPSGTAGTPPNIHALLKAAMGGYTNTPSTSDVYSLADSQSALGSLSIVHHYPDVVMEAASGCWVEQVKFSGAGANPPKVAFEGEGIEHHLTGTSTCSGATSGSTVTPADGVAGFSVGSVLQIGASTNTGAGHKVTAVGSTTLTVEGTPAGSDGDAIIPFTPTETTAGSPVAGISGSVTIGGSSLPITAFEVVLKNGIKPVNDEAFASAATDYIVGWRSVTGSLTVRARKDQIIRMGTRKSFSSAPLVVLTLGAVAGKRCKLEISAEFDISALEVPESDEATVTLPFTALGLLGADEFTVTFY